MKDGYGRKIDYLRLSVTDRCNFKCIYCTDGRADSFSHSYICTADEIVLMARAAVNLGITKVRITGGEPLVRPDVIEICERIKSIKGVEELDITTNGFNIKNSAARLKSAGVDRINLSVDSLVRSTSSAISRSDYFTEPLDMVDFILNAGFKELKINTVLLNGINSSEIRDFVELTKEKDITVRFIELMPIGPSESLFKSLYLDSSFVLQTCPTLERVGTSGVSELYRIPTYKGTVGLIRPVSSKFCSFCNRIRITCDGKLKTCLHGSAEVDLRGLDINETEEKIKSEVLLKPRCHALDTERKSSSMRSMLNIGG